MTEHFKALSSDVLRNNSEEFRKQATASFQQQQENADHLLKQREQSISSLIKPIADALKKTEEQIRQAIAGAHADEFIDKLPQGLDTLVGDNGVLLSGGQRQRIAIARALLKNAPILILDEATSSIDSESEQWIQRATEALTEGRTSLLVAHRLNTVRDADRIVVLHQGQIVEQGTHDDLVALGQVYHGLFEMQFQALEGEG